MTDAEGVEFLRWCLPRLRLAWYGFRLRRIRGRVYRGIEERMAELAVTDIRAYRTYLERAADEWAVLDRLCWIPISRFYRDRVVFEFLERTVLPELTAQAVERAETEVRCWSAGCAAGEEPNTLAMIWKARLAPRFPTVHFRIVATDIDPTLIGKATAACYPAYSVKDLPADLAAQALHPSPGGYRVREEFRAGVEFVQQDIRHDMPGGPFHLILCRNLVLTYFEETLQRAILEQIGKRLLPAGAVIFGLTESLPAGVLGLEPWSARLKIYRRGEHHPSGAPLPQVR